MDWQLTCRVCLETGDMVSLFDWDENNEQLSDKYTYCCGIEVTKNDALPSLICLNCVDRLTFSYQFKQQCLSSIETLKECLEEFQKSSAVVSASNPSSSKETETITIKQENGVLVRYELPVEQTPTWTRTVNKSGTKAVVTKAPEPRKRGRPRKYPNEHGQIDISPYTRKKPRESKPEPQSLTSLLEISDNDMKKEPEDQIEEDDDQLGDDDFQNDDDPDFNAENEDGGGSDDDDGDKSLMPPPAPKRGRPRKTPSKKSLLKKDEDSGEDVLLQETIMAYSEPIPDHILNPKPKERKKHKYVKRHGCEKIHTCETCGSSFTSNASLQAHIRRHLGIKPFVCSICGYASVSKEALRRHMMRHTGERPYKCRICERRFGDFGTRQKHERLHMGVKPYQCSVCGRAFTYSYVLANHMLTHTGEKKYSCGPCNKKFTKAHHLKYHNKVHHKELYLQQQMESEAKKMKQTVNLGDLSGVITGQIVDGKLQIIQMNVETEGDEPGDQLHVAEEAEDNEDSEVKETDRAVADMQAVVMESDYCIEIGNKD